MSISREDITFEPIVDGDEYVDRIREWGDADAEITFGWRIFVRGEPFGICWVEMCQPYGLIHGISAVSGRYVPFISREAFLLCESAVRSLGLIPAVVYPKEYLHVKRLCDIVGYKSISLDNETMIATSR